MLIMQKSDLFGAMLESGVRMTGSAHVVVDHGRFTPTQAARPICQAILTTAALVIVKDLGLRRLADVDDRFARELVG